MCTKIKLCAEICVHVVNEGNVVIRLKAMTLLKMPKKRKKGRLITSHRYDHLPLLPSGPGGVQQELVV